MTEEEARLRAALMDIADTAQAAIQRWQAVGWHYLTEDEAALYDIFTRCNNALLYEAPK